MKNIEVCLSPELMHLYEVQNCTVVVVDIFRATSTMVAALAHGIHVIVPFANQEACLAMKAKGYYTAGERNGEKLKGFDLGNSPFEYMEESLQGKKIAFTTTNGTLAIDKSKGAKEIIIGSFLNLTAITNHLLKGSNNVLVVCAGWKGKVNLEDTIFAGALVELLKMYINTDCDASVAAQHLYNMAKYNLVDFLKESSHVKRLAKLNVYKDISFCLTPDQYPIVPVLKDGVIQIFKN